MAKEKWRALTNPSSKEMDAKRIEIQCIDPPKAGETEGAGYIVTVTPKTKEDKPGKMHKGFGYIEPIQRVFSSSDELIGYLSKIL